MTESVAGRLIVHETLDFWSAHLWIPLAWFLSVFGLIEWLGADRVVAHALFFDTVADRWLGSGTNDWWARQLIHNDGRWLTRSIAAAALALWWLSPGFARLRPWRREAAFLFVAIAASIAVVGALKAVTNVDCPWNLAGFGGDRPYVALFASRPAGLPHAQCFPGAHSASGFALVGFYFALRDRSRRVAHGALIAACLIGMVFSLGQQARGAHFLSHDLASAALVWFVQLALYARWLKPRAGRE